MAFGRKLRSLRKAKGLTLEMMARRIGSSKGYISGIENEKVRPPREPFVRRLARLLGEDEVSFLKLAYLDKVPQALRPEFERMGVWGSGAQAAAAEPDGIPLINGVTEGYPLDVGGDGLPLGRRRDRIVIPGLPRRDAFAVTVCGDAMSGASGVGFRQGDLAVAARAAQVENGDTVFALFSDAGRTQAHLRVVMLIDSETVALQALNREHPILFVRRAELRGMFKVIARVALFDGWSEGSVWQASCVATAGHGH